MKRQTDLGPVMVVIASLISLAFVLRVGWQLGKTLAVVIHGG